jgi:hypothetical protein
MQRNKSIQPHKSTQHAPEPAPGGDHSLCIVQPCLLESPECISRQHLGPLVAVVACAVAASKDVAEGAQEAVSGVGGHHLEQQQQQQQ